MFASIDQQQFQWIEFNQNIFHASHFNNLEDASADDPDNLDLNEIGQYIFLLSSYTSGPCNMGQGFQDLMAIARFFWKVNIFLTMVTNPQ